MSRYGRLLLRRIRLQYCDHTTPSQGLREYLQDHLSEFKQQNPHVNVETIMKRGKLPYIHAEYLYPRAALRGVNPSTTGQTMSKKAAAELAAATSARTIGVKHKSAAEIREHLWWLRCGQGRNAQKRVPGKHWVSKQPSIQGAWTVNTHRLVLLQQQ